MTRRDRLLDLQSQLLRQPRTTAAALANALDVTPRTIYRDIETLRTAGIDIRGTRGTGYHIPPGITLPPLTLSLPELEALHLGLAAIAQAGDPDLASAADSLATKLDALLPEDTDIATAPLALDPVAATGRALPYLPVLRHAVRARQVISVEANGLRHVLRPLRLGYWGRIWTLTAWSETTNDFIDLRVDLIAKPELLPRLFVDETGKRLQGRP